LWRMEPRSSISQMATDDFSIPRVFLSPVAYLLFVTSLLYILCSFEVFRISSTSMALTILPNDYVLVRHDWGLQWWKRRFFLQRGQIVVFRAPSGEPFVVKRVIAMGGESIRIRGGQIMVNGNLLSEPYLPKTASAGNPFSSSWPLDMRGAGTSEFLVPPHSYFVMGDNRSESTDSRHWGAVPEEDIYGPVVFIWH